MSTTKSHMICPRCKKGSASDPRGWFAPEACRAVNGPKHLICRACVNDTALTAATICRESRSEPFLKCGFGNCKHVWRYNDWTTSPAKAAGEIVQQFYVDLALAGMKDVRHCPSCKRAGWIGTGACPNTICSDEKCNMVFCSQCLSVAHKGPCGSPQDEPDMLISSEKFFNLDAVLGNHAGLRTIVRQTAYFTERKDELSTDDALVFTLRDMLNHAERGALLHAVEAAGFESLEKVYPADYRSNDRVLARSRVLASALFDRILPCLKASDLRHTPMGPSGEGLWLPCGLNEVFKFARYKTGCFFKPHRDGLWAPSIDLMSVFSVVIYLNSAQNSYGEPRLSCFKGGDTRFFPHGGDPDKPVSVTPTAGGASVFTQSLMHDGAALTSGTKYILRTEIMYRRVKSVLDRSPALLAACDDLRRIGELYKRSTQGMESGKADQFLRDYLEAIELQAKPRPQSQRLPIPDDVMVSVLSLVSDRDIAQFARVNRSFYRLSRDNALWRTRLRAMYPDVAPFGPQDLSVDWHLRYRNEILQRVGPRPPQSQVIALDLGSGLIKTSRFGAVAVQPSFYTISVEEYMSHGSRCKMDVVSPITMKEAVVWTAADAQRHGALRAITDDHEITQKGIEVVGSAINLQYRSNPGRHWLPIVIVPDDWSAHLLTTHLRLSSYLRHPMRFVCTSEAVAKRFNVRSAVVLMLGHSLHHISVVENMHVTRIQYIENFTYSKCDAIAESVHQVLLGSSAPPPPAPLVEAQEAASAVLSAGQSEVNARMATVVKDLMKKVSELNPYIQENARTLVGHRVLVSGGKVHVMAEWIAKFKAALAKRSHLWKVSIAQAHLDAVVGAASLSYFEEPVFRFGLSQPARRVPPLV